MGYDESFNNYFGSEDAEKFIKEIVFTADLFFKQPDTGLPIINWKLGDKISFYNINVNADQLCCETETCEKEKGYGKREAQRLRKGNSVPLMLFAEDRHPKGGEQFIGCAFQGAACGNTQGLALGVVDMSRQVSDRQNIQPMARTMAHEFGHLVSKFIQLPEKDIHAINPILPRL